MTQISAFDRAIDAWQHLSSLRSLRRRLKNFTYGDQWNWPVIDHDGNIVSEGDSVRQMGKTPLTNNLLRSLVKSVVGRFRHLSVSTSANQVTSANQLDELDARTLEEFLISGCAIQRVVIEKRPEGKGVWVDRISPAEFFVNRFSDPRGSDISTVGMLHEMDCEQMIMRFGHGSARRARMLRAAFERCAVSPGSLCGDSGAGGFSSASASGKCRVIEVWTLDYEGNRRNNPTSYSVGWHCRYFTPDATLLDHTGSPYPGGAQPFVIKFYPLTDGEVHPFIEDIVEQQRHINRLITMIDHVLSVSAKGVLLMPVDAVPDGLSISDTIRLWNRPGGVIPINPHATRVPEQLSSDGSTDNAARLLDIEMNMMRQISGVSAALQGQTSDIRQSASMFESQIQNSAIALLDIFETFNSFRSARDAKMKQFSGN